MIIIPPHPLPLASFMEAAICTCAVVNICRTKLCAFRSLTSVSMNSCRKQCFIFCCRYTPPDVCICSCLSAHICVCMEVCKFMRTCVKHVGVCLQTSVFVSVIGVSMHICFFVWVCMNAHAQICLVKVIFFSRFLPCSDRKKTRCTYSSIYVCMCFEFTGVNLHVIILLFASRLNSPYVLIVVTVASICTVEDAFMSLSRTMPER